MDYIFKEWENRLSDFADSVEKDLAEIWDYYRSRKVMGKHPEQFNLYDEYEKD